MRVAQALSILLLSILIAPPARAQEPDGEISGVVLNAAGRPLADQRVELRRPREQGAGQLVTTTDANGASTYKRLRPGRYEVE